MKVSLIVSQEYTVNVKTLKIAVLLPGYVSYDDLQIQDDFSSEDSQKQGALSADFDGYDG